MGEVLSRRSRGSQLLVGSHDYHEAGIHTATQKVFWSVVIMVAEASRRPANRRIITKEREDEQTSGKIESGR
jgi:hypothetical protein